MAKVTIPQFQKMKDRGEKLALLTAYDFTFARLFDRAGIDALLVGDSLGMVIQGNHTTLPVTLDQMAYHGRAVAKGAERAHVIVDLPFGSYQASTAQAVQSAVKLCAEGGAESVKLEGGADFAEPIAAIVRAGIPVMGHIGLTPQSVHKLGGHVVQGRGTVAALQLRKDAKALEEAGCYALVLEAIPAELAAEISKSLRIPTIGIGAGEGCDGQILVGYDMLGLNPDFKPRFVKRFAELHETIGAATQGYVDEVKRGVFPSAQHSFSAEPPVRLADAGGGAGYGPK